MDQKKEMLPNSNEQQSKNANESLSEATRVGKRSKCGRRLADPVPLPQGDIVCRRTRSGPRFNIQQRIKYHSPTGMEWGHGGSGPADFALNILSLFVPEKEAFRLHQQFKWDVVARLPREGGEIKRGEILEWLRAQGVEAGSHKEVSA